MGRRSGICPRRPARERFCQDTMFLHCALSLLRHRRSRRHSYSRKRLHQWLKARRAVHRSRCPSACLRASAQRPSQASRQQKAMRRLQRTNCRMHRVTVPVSRCLRRKAPPRQRHPVAEEVAVVVPGCPAWASVAAALAALPATNIMHPRKTIGPVRPARRHDVHSA